MMLSEIIIKTC